METLQKSAWQVFVLMPFQPEFDSMFEEGIREGARKANATAERVDEQKYDGTIMARVVGQIEAADLVVAVLVGNRPNVMYEVGLAHGLQKRVVLVTDDANAIAFDLKDFPYVVHNGSNTDLAEAISSKIQWCRENPSARDSYCMAYREGLKQVESVDSKLFPFLVPLAQRRFSEWSISARELVGAGIMIKGPDRLAITEQIIARTRAFRIMDPFVADPSEVHSKDWLQFYDRIGQQRDIEKAWFLCIDLAKVENSGVLVRANRSFYLARGFKTYYCQPSDLVESLGSTAPDRVIENYGEFVKMLSLDGPSYKKGGTPNEIRTTLRTCTPEDEQLYLCVQRCSEEMDEAWVTKNCR
jgi:nucleoside 2-deoxyribosyltransferase